MSSALPRFLLSAPAALIASVVIVSLAAWLIPPLKGAMILVPYRVREGFQIHRLLTAGWLHSDATHLLFNMLSLYFFAGEVERALGANRFLILYFAAVVLGFIPTTLRHMRNPRYASLGASGAVAAVMFSAILLYPKLKLYLMFIPIPVPGLVFALAYLAYSAWNSHRARDGVNHDAHFAGAVVGAALTYLFEPAQVERTVRSFVK
ncbi:MAG: rhomboid family intramembrane serine protease [Polyangiaceae bacterium]|nr:rhomboid family intramembrane serine protease [Polyangiaceae bacterium]